MTHQETGASPREEKPGLRSQVEANENMSEERGGRQRALGLVGLCSHWDPGHGQNPQSPDRGHRGSLSFKDRILAGIASPTGGVSPK